MIKKAVSRAKRKTKSIQTLIILPFSALIIITILVSSIVSISLTTEEVKNNSYAYNRQLIEQVNSNIEAYISYMEHISTIAVYNSDVREYLSSDNLSIEDSKRYRAKINDLFNPIIISREDISSVMLLGNDNRNIILSDRNVTELNGYNSIYEQSWYIEAIEAAGEPVISSSHIQNLLKEDEYRWVVSLSRLLKSGSINYGMFVVNLNYSVINDMLNKIKLGNRGYIFIIDNKGDIVYHPQQQLIYSNVKEEVINEILNAKEDTLTIGKGSEGKIYNIKVSDKTGWHIVGVSYVNELVASKNQIVRSYFLWGLISVLSAILISIFIALKISKPVKILESHMHQVESGNFDIEVNMKNTSYEISELSKTFNIMIKRIRELILQNVEEHHQKRKSQLKALQSQVNPHFLYNTLDSIIWMAEGNKNKDVVKMTSALSKLFRISISKGEDIISIKAEIQHINSYLIIQKMRYKNKLDYTIDIKEEILNCKTLKIILQPLVENAIYHGIKNKAGIGHVIITGDVIDHKIRLQVIDNGIGIAKDQIEKIMDKSFTSTKGNGIGINNVNERIKLYFGEEYGLVFNTNYKNGTCIDIWIPILPEEDET